MNSSIHLRNLIICLFLIVAYYSYYEKIMPSIVSAWDWAPPFNLIILPFLVGIISFQLFSGQYIVRLLFVFLIPAVSLIPQLFEGDAAKPGIQFFVYFALISGFCVGAFAGIAIKELGKKLLRK